MGTNLYPKILEKLLSDVLCCWIPLVLVVFHLGDSFSSSTWNASASRVDIFINIINNNVNTSSIKTIANIMFPPPLSIVGARTTPLSNVRISVLLKGPAGLGAGRGCHPTVAGVQHDVVVAADDDVV